MVTVRAERRIICIIGMICLFMLSGLPAAVAGEKIRINGSGSCLDAMKPLIKAYGKANPKVTIEMGNPLGSSGAIKALLAGALDIVVSSKRLKSVEISQGAHSREYGRMPLAIITQKKVPKVDITTRELAEIYSLKLTRWPDGGPIRIILRPEGDIDTNILRQLSPAINHALNVAQKQEGMVIAVTDPEAIDRIEKLPGALGWSGLSSLIVEKHDVNQLTLNGIKPSVKALSAGSYPLAKDARFITTARTPAAALKFLEFVYSPQGLAIAEKAGLLISPDGKSAK